MNESDKIALAYAQLFSMETGKIVFADLRKRYEARTSFSADPYTTAFKEGQRDVYLTIRSLIERAALTMSAAQGDSK